MPFVAWTISLRCRLLLSNRLRFRGAVSSVSCLMTHDQGRKAHFQDFLRGGAAGVVFRNEQQLLRVLRSSRYHHSTARLELFNEHRRYPLRRCGDHDLVIRCVLWPPVVTVAQPNFDVVVFQTPQSPAGFLRELLDYLNRVYALRELGEDCRLISKPSANFEDLVGWFDLQQVSHQRNDERLRDRLCVPDRQRDIQIRKLPERRRHELMAGNVGQNSHDALVELVFAYPRGSEARAFRNHLHHLDAQRAKIDFLVGRHLQTCSLDNRAGHLEADQHSRSTNEVLRRNTNPRAPKGVASNAKLGSCLLSNLVSFPDPYVLLLPQCELSFAVGACEPVLRLQSTSAALLASEREIEPTGH